MVYCTLIEHKFDVIMVRCFLLVFILGAFDFPNLACTASLYHQSKPLVEVYEPPSHIQHWSGHSEYINTEPAEDGKTKIRVTGRDVIAYEEFHVELRQPPSRPPSIIDTFRLSMASPTRPLSVKITDWIAVSLDGENVIRVRQHAATFAVAILRPFSAPLIITGITSNNNDCGLSDGNLFVIMKAASSIDFASNFALHEYWMGWRTLASLGEFLASRAIAVGHLFSVGQRYNASVRLPRLPYSRQLHYDRIDGILLYHGGHSTPGHIPSLKALAMQAVPSMRRLLKMGVGVVEHLCMNPAFFLEFISKALLDLIDLPVRSKARRKMAENVNSILASNTMYQQVQDQLLMELVRKTVDGPANSDSVLDDWISFEHSGKTGLVSVGRIVLDKMVMAIYQRDPESCVDAFRRYRFVQFIKTRLPLVPVRYAYLAAAMVFDLMHELDRAVGDKVGVDFDEDEQEHSALDDLDPPAMTLWCILEYFVNTSAASFTQLLYRHHLSIPEPTSRRLSYDHRPLAEWICEDHKRYVSLLTAIRELVKRTGTRSSSSFSGAVAECHRLILTIMNRLPHHSPQTADMIISVLAVDHQLMEAADLKQRVGLLRWLIVRPGGAHPSTRLFLQCLFSSMAMEKLQLAQAVSDVLITVKYYRGDEGLDAAVMFLGRYGPLHFRSLLRWIIEDQHPLNPDLKQAVRSAPGISLRHNHPRNDEVITTTHRLHHLIRIGSSEEASSQSALSWTVWTGRPAAGARHDHRNLLLLDRPVPNDILLSMMTSAEQVLQACPYNHLWVQLQSNGIRIRSGAWRRLYNDDQRSMFMAIMLPDRISVKRVKGGDITEIIINEDSTLIVYALAPSKAALYTQLPGVLFSMTFEHHQTVALLARSLVDALDDGVLSIAAVIHIKKQNAE